MVIQQRAEHGHFDQLLSLWHNGQDITEVVKYTKWPECPNLYPLAKCADKGKL